MNSGTQPMTERRSLYLRPLRKHWSVWLSSTLVFTAAAVAFSILGPREWLASQDIVIRDQSLGTQIGSGQVDTYGAIETVEETLHGVHQNRQLAMAVLQDIGPPENTPNLDQWPMLEDVEDFLGNLNVSTSKEAGFGDTKVMHLNVKASTPERAVALTSVLCTKLEQQLGQRRAERSDQLIQELTLAATLAEEELNQAAEQLAEVERSVGSDLNELRMIDQLGAGGNGNLILALRLAQENLAELKRQATEIEHRRDELRSIQNDPQAFSSAPMTVLSVHTTLAQLKSVLVETELELTRVLAKYDEIHPRVRRVREELEHVHQRVEQETSIALEGATVDAEAVNQKIEDLERVTKELTARLERIALVRRDYNRLSAKVEQKKKEYATVSSRLTQVEASQQSVEAPSIIKRIGEPVVNAHSIGPNKKAVVAGGVLVGLAVGFGLVFLIVPSGGGEPNVVSVTGTLSETANAGLAPLPNVSPQRAETRTHARQPVEQVNHEGTKSSVNRMVSVSELPGPQPVRNESSFRSAKKATVRPKRAGGVVPKRTKQQVAARSASSSLTTLTETKEPRFKPRRVVEMRSESDTVADVINDLHELREEMLRSHRSPT